MGKQTILLIIIVGALLGTGYFLYQYFQSGPALQALPRTETEFQIKLAELKRLKELRLDTSIFQDQFFRTLEPPEIPAETPLTPGRNNPFLAF